MIGKHLENCFDSKRIHLLQGVKFFFKSPVTGMQVSVT